MGATYSKLHRQLAKERKQHLATIDLDGRAGNVGGGKCFQGPVSEEEAKEINDFFIGFLERHVKGCPDHMTEDEA